MNWITIFLVLLGLILLGVIISIPAITKITRIRQTPTYYISALPAEGQAEVIGKTKGALIQSPVSKQECIFWKIDVEELRKSGKSSSWHTVYSTSSGEVNVVDDTGEIPIAISQAELDTRGDMFDKDSPGVDSLIAEYGLETIGFLGFDKKMRLTECVVTPGEEVFVRGVVKSRDGSKMLTSGGMSSPLMISHQGEEGLLLRLYRQVGLTILGTVVIIGGIILIIYFER